MVEANFAITADGKITTRTNAPSQFSSTLDKRRLLEIRANCDAVIVGRGTAVNDRMTLGIPDAALVRARTKAGRTAWPVRVIVSNSGGVPASLPAFKKRDSPLVVFTSSQISEKALGRLGRAGASVVVHPKDHVDLRALLSHLSSEYHVKRVVIEGGATLFRSFLAADLVDWIHITHCPVVFGGAKVPGITGPPGDFLPAAIRLRRTRTEGIGGECFTTYRVVRE